MGWSTKNALVGAAVTVNNSTFAAAVTGGDVSNVITLNPGETCVAEIEYDPPATPTDDLIVAIQATLDDSSENWDDEPFMTFVVPRTPDPCKRTIIVSGLYKFRFVFYMTGTTDTTGTVTTLSQYRKDGVNA